MQVCEGLLRLGRWFQQAPPGAHTWLEIPVPFPNTAVKQPGPMIVLSAKVGQCRVIFYAATFSRAWLRFFVPRGAPAAP